MAADFHRPNRPLFRHPDWFVALRARLSFGRDLWPRHVRDTATNYADALFSPVMHQTLSGVFLAALRPYVRHCKSSVQHICPTGCDDCHRQAVLRTCHVCFAPESRHSGCHQKKPRDVAPANIAWAEDDRGCYPLASQVSSPALRPLRTSLMPDSRFIQEQN